MIKLLTTLVILLASAPAPAQNKKPVDNYSTKIENTVLKVFDLSGKQVLAKKFNDPLSFSSDLDGDGVNEIIVDDNYTVGSGVCYTMYIYNCIDEFKLADSIVSGLRAPYVSNSEEIGPVIISGNPKFDSLNKDTADVFVPISCWKYEDGEVFNINDEVYNLFIGENEDTIDYLDSYFESEGKNCRSSKAAEAAIASTYVNYLNAGEKALAEHFLERYYFCHDVSDFKKKIETLL